MLIRCAPVQRQLAHDQHTYMVCNSNRTDALAIRELVRVHHTDDHDSEEQCITHREAIISSREAVDAMAKHGRAEVGVTSGNSKEGVDSEEKDEDLSHEGEVMVYEAALLACVERRPCSFVNESSVESGFEDVLSAEEKECEELGRIRRCWLDV
jgi:hypothetical protein